MESKCLTVSVYRENLCPFLWELAVRLAVSRILVHHSNPAAEHRAVLSRHPMALSEKQNYSKSPIQCKIGFKLEHTFFKNVFCSSNESKFGK